MQYCLLLLKVIMYTLIQNNQYNNLYCVAGAVRLKDCLFIKQKLDKNSFNKPFLSHMHVRRTQWIVYFTEFIFTLYYIYIYSKNKYY